MYVFIYVCMYVAMCPYVSVVANPQEGVLKSGKNWPVLFFGSLFIWLIWMYKGKANYVIHYVHNYIYIG